MEIVEVMIPGKVKSEGLRVRTRDTRELGPSEAGRVLVREEADGVSFAEKAVRHCHDRPKP